MGDVGGVFDDDFKVDVFFVVFGGFDRCYQCVDGIDIGGIVDFWDYDLVQLFVCLFQQVDYIVILEGCVQFVDFD